MLFIFYYGSQRLSNCHSIKAQLWAIFLISHTKEAVGQQNPVPVSCPSFSHRENGHWKRWGEVRCHLPSPSQGRSNTQVMGRAIPSATVWAFDTNVSGLYFAFSFMMHAADFTVHVNTVSSFSEKRMPKEWTLSALNATIWHKWRTALIYHYFPSLAICLLEK